MSKPAYLLAHEWEQESRRLELLEGHADPVTIRRLETAGAAAGRRCLEIGAGRGSIARWLARRVGRFGRVTALDLDAGLLDRGGMRNLDVVEADVLEVELPERSFDLIHTRCVLMHIPERRRALERMASWLRPGGCIVAEELDWMAALTDADPERVALFRAFDAGLPTIDFACGGALAGELKALGLEAVAEFCVDVVEGATPLAEWEQLSILALSERVLEAGTATPDQIARHLARLNDPGYRGLGWTWVGAYAQSAAD